MELGSLCVFCGSSEGNHHSYFESAAALGSEMAKRGIRLVYGGGNIGLMGAVSKSVIESGGRVLGVIPHGLRKKENTGDLDLFTSHEGRVEMRVVPDMHTRKSTMAENADAFIAMPGGYGTLEELFEVVTWAQLGIHSKPIGLLNVNGYYDSLLKFLDDACASGFISESARSIIRSHSDPSELINMLHVPSQYQSKIKWTNP